MKFWRIFAAAVMVGMLIPPAVVLADDDDDDDDMGPGPGIVCEADTAKTLVQGLVMCVEMQNDTQSSFGNQFPWENSTGLFATYRNQFLYPSSTVDDERAQACTIESIQSRGSSFASSSVTTYGSFANNAVSSIIISDATADNLVNTFALNPGPNTYGALTGTDTNPITIDTVSAGSLLSNCSTCPDNRWTGVLDLETPGAITNLLVDQTVDVQSGTGNTSWDVTSSAFGQGCAGPERGYGSGAFANPNHLTTALGIDEAAFVWVFEGLAPPPPATVQQQISEIIRLLLTPEGLRCSFLDLAVNGKLQDDALAYPDGADYDPISPRVTSNQTKAGAELKEGRRSAGFDHP